MPGGEQPPSKKGAADLEASAQPPGGEAGRVPFFSPAGSARRAYLDHASTSPLRPEAREAMLPWLGAADPSRVHTEGRMARAALEHAREQVADFFGTRPRQVVFTSGATEAIHAATHGCLSAGRGTEVVLPEVEHSAVREASLHMASRVRWVGVDRSARVDAAEVEQAMGPGTALVHCQWANHEIGTLQPVAEVVSACRQRGVLVHVDAAAAAGRVRVDFDSLGADLMSVSAHKLGGPRGIGALLVRRGLRLEPMLAGGAQERGRRAGMENVAAAVGFGAAVEALATSMESEMAKVAALAEQLRAGVSAIPGVAIYGPSDRGERLAHIVAMGIQDVEAEAVLLGLDQAGVAAHSGSACASEELEPSPVLTAMGLPANSSLRLSLGWSSTEEDVLAALEALRIALERLRALRAG